MGKEYKCIDGACIISCSNPKTAADSCIIEIPDINLKKVILQTIGKSTGEVTVGEAKKISSLTGSIKSITNIKGLEYFLNLKTLNLRHNQISNVDALKDLTSLTYLGLGDNQIFDISALKDLTALNYLYLGSNQISDVSALKSLTSLKELKLFNNRISDVSTLKDLTSLQQLYLGDNIIEYSTEDCNAMNSLKDKFVYISGFDFNKCL